MGRIVAIAGGNWESTHKINQYIVALAGREKANLLFIGTASHDAVEYIEVIHTEFESLGCDVKELNLTSEKYTDEEIDELLDQADIIYVGGGDTAFMVNAWREYGLDSKLKKVYLTDRAVLSGISAGAMCWFNCGHSDSSVFWKDGNIGYGWVDGLLDIHSYAFCPHYDERKDSFDEMIREKPLPGMALDENVAFVDENGSVHFISSKESAKAYLMTFHDGKLVKQEQKVVVL